MEHIIATEKRTILHEYFDIINQRLFNGVLIRPVLCFNALPPKGIAGQTVFFDGRAQFLWVAWVKNADEYYLADILIHEMVHLYLAQEGIEEPPSGNYHSEKFRDKAIECGLLVLEEKYGYNKTKLRPNHDILQYLPEWDGNPC